MRLTRVSLRSDTSLSTEPEGGAGMSSKQRDLIPGAHASGLDVCMASWLRERPYVAVVLGGFPTGTGASAGGCRT